MYISGRSHTAHRHPIEVHRLLNFLQVERHSTEVEGRSLGHTRSLDNQSVAKFKKLRFDISMFWRQSTVDLPCFLLSFGDKEKSLKRHRLLRPGHPWRFSLNVSRLYEWDILWLAWLDESLTPGHNESIPINCFASHWKGIVCRFSCGLSVAIEVLFYES